GGGEGVAGPRGSGGVVAVLGVIAHRMAHPAQAAFVHQVDDQLELVEALKVRALLLVAGLDQGVETGHHQRGHPAAEHRLLAEQIGLRFFLERRLNTPARVAPSARAYESPSGLAVPPASRWTAIRAGAPTPSPYSRATQT